MTEKEKAERDRKEFERLRMYYRLNFEDGASDAAFLEWIARMVEQSARA
jgi:hypothetical protein